MTIELHVPALAGRAAARTDQATALAVHVLSQSPVDTIASVPGFQARRWPVALLAPALGVGDRVHLHSADGRSRRAGSSVVVLDPEDLPTPADLLADVGEGGAPPHTAAEHLAGSRIAIVTTIPIHYRVALFNEMQKILSAHGAQLRIFFLSGIPSDRPWIVSEEPLFEHVFLQSIDLGRAKGRHLFPKRLAAVREFAPTILVVAGFAPWVAMRLVGSWRGRRRPAIGIWSGEIPSRPTAQSKLRTLQRRALIERADFGIAYGWESARYLHGLSPQLPVVIGRNTTSVVAPSASGRSDGERRVEVITVGRAEPGKALDVLIDAAGELKDLSCRLTIVGDGPELPVLKARAAGLENVRFLGALHSNAVAAELRRSDVFVFPSQYDIFGLVLVEAMAAGLAVATSDKPGAVADLCASERNCLVVDWETPKAWSTAIGRLVGDARLRRRLGTRAQQTIDERWTIAHSANAMVSGLTLGLHASRGSKCV